MSDCFKFSQPRSATRVIGGMEGKCIPGTDTPLSRVRHWQTRVVMEGYAKVERMFFTFQRDTQDSRVTCADDCEPVNCCPAAVDYAYHIAPEGENTNEFFLPRPSDVPAETWNSTQTFTATCPEGQTGAPVTRTGTATSTVSQAHADSRALGIARTAANTELSCSGTPAGCSIQQLDFRETIGSTTVDYSAFFATGYLSSTNGLWRLLDLQTITLYATGTVDATGTLQIDWNETTGLNTFNATTKILDITSGDNQTLLLETGCPNGGDIDWFTEGAG